MHSLIYYLINVITYHIIAYNMNNFVGGPLLDGQDDSLLRPDADGGGAELDGLLTYYTIPTLVVYYVILYFGLDICCSCMF